MSQMALNACSQNGRVVERLRILICFQSIRSCGMSPVKQQVIEMTQSLPDGSTVDDIMAELYFRMKVDAGLKELDEGKTVSHEGAKDRLSQWLSR
jgi:hypothetical protein